MTDVLKARIPAGTHTNQRRLDNTETPKQVVDMKKTGQSNFSAWNALASQAAVLTFVSGAKEHSTAPSGVEAPLVSSPQDQADAIFEAGGADLLARLGQVLSAIIPVARGEDFDLAKVVEPLLNYSILMAPRRIPSSTSTQADRRYDCFRSKLIAALLDEPIEDGVTHPAERLIDDAFLTDPSDCQDWLSQALVEHYPTRPSLCASIVRCIGRLEYDRVRGWGMHVVDDALQNRSAEVREAAIRALEAWGGRAALDMLRGHQDAEAWLNEYVQQVVLDLSRTAS